MSSLGMAKPRHLSSCGVVVCGLMVVLGMWSIASRISGAELAGLYWRASSVGG